MIVGYYSYYSWYSIIDILDHFGLKVDFNCCAYWPSIAAGSGSAMILTTLSNKWDYAELDDAPQPAKGTHLIHTISFVGWRNLGQAQACRNDRCLLCWRLQEQTTLAHTHTHTPYNNTSHQGLHPTNGSLILEFLSRPTGDFSYLHSVLKLRLNLPVQGLWLSINWSPQPAAASAAICDIDQAKLTKTRLNKTYFLHIS